MSLNIIDNIEHLLPVAGIRLGAVAAGIRYENRTDLSLIEINPEASVAAVFTQNAFCAAPVSIAKKHLAAGTPRYLLINAGNANAGTGQPGVDNAMACCEAVAGQAQCQAYQVLPFSTGVMGEDIPLEKFTQVIPKLVNTIDAHHWHSVARAIMTTDTVPKGVSCQVTIGNDVVTITGVAKGVGMIRPNMATLLAYIATDANIEKSLLDNCLHQAVEQSFNRITVDGDTSTNDACVLIATGQSMATIGKPGLSEFQAALNTVCEVLARALVKDGEGATKLINIRVSGGKDEIECKEVAYTVAHSPLVKTAFFASDPNWGRILAAVGRTEVDNLDVSKIRIYLDEVCIVEQGARAKTYNEELGQLVMDKTEITVSIDLARGNAETHIWTCDFSYDYVRINAEYRS